MPKQETPTVSDLLARARQGDDRCREELFDACRDYLNLVARAQVESWLRAKVDASDLVQQTLFEAHRDFARFEGGSEAEWLGWLRRILTHNARDFIRRYRGTAKREARREVAIRQPGDASHAGGCPEPCAPGLTPSQELIRRDDELRVAAALARLSPDHREAIVLRNLQRLPFDEVAARLGRSRPAAQMLWMRAIKKLQEALEEVDHDGGS